MAVHVQRHPGEVNEWAAWSDSLPGIRTWAADRDGAIGRLRVLLRRYRGEDVELPPVRVDGVEEK